MRIHGLTVCVNYADFLAVSLPRWMSGLATLTIVTTPEDEATQALAMRHGANVFATSLFYADGAAFNKGRAMEAARVWAEAMIVKEAGWRLFFDSDVLPPLDWKTRLGELEPGCLYGCLRYDAQVGSTEDIGQPKCAHDVPGVGYFQLFHSQDQVVQRAPLLDTHWTHAGNYDNRFMDLWRERGIRVKTVPFRVAHIGERENWFGRGNRAAFEAMKAERMARGGGWTHERIGGRGVIACVLRSGGIYTPEHVARLAAQVRTFAPEQLLVCLTDMPVPGVVTAPLMHRWPGWWSKLELFRPDVFPAGERVPYLDLDTTLVGPLDDLLARSEPFIALADFYRRPPVVPVRGLGSGLLMWTAGEHDVLYTDFVQAPEPHMVWCGHGGDQRFIEARKLAETTFWEDVVPGQVVSYKVHCQDGVPDGARVVCFHGRPKPWQVPELTREALCQAS